jgi:uncharacterized protein
MHCPKCMIQSEPNRWPDGTRVPTLAEGMVAHGSLPETVAEMQALIDKDGATRLY